MRIVVVAVRTEERLRRVARLMILLTFLIVLSFLVVVGGGFFLFRVMALTR